MNSIYQHRQFGLAMLAIMIIPTLGLIAAVGLANQPAALPPLVIVLAVLISTMIIFGSLTVEVDARQISLYFGGGLLRRAVPVEQIRQVKVVRNPLWMGLGIHFFPGGIIYNVSGLDAVELTLQDGRLIRIGSDEPGALAKAIETSRRQTI